MLYRNPLLQTFLMGCAPSNLDGSPAVALCRQRCAFIDEAVRHRFAFAEAHAAYLLSLKAVGLSLDRFFFHDLPPSALRPSSPLLNLPPRRKGDPHSPPPNKPHHLHSRSDSGSHLRFSSGSDDENGFGPESSHHHRGVTSPPHELLTYATYVPDYISGGKNVNYMRNETTPSVVHTLHIDESTASSSSYYPNFNDSSPNFNGYSNYGGGGGFLGDSSVSAAPPAAPPSPPRSSTWDFLNPFETVEKFYPAYSSSHNDREREVREEEGIPDLEEDNDDDDDDEVVVKKKDKGVVNGDHERVASGRNSYSNAPKENVVDSKQNVNKIAVKAEQSSKNGDEIKPRGGFKDDFEVLKEIQAQFDRASQSGNELSKFLEVGKLPYKQKQASSKILHLTAVSFQPSTFKAFDTADPAFVDILQDVELKSKSLSSVLHKLYLWEKKLYEEVKAEEKLRVVHERKSKKLKLMDERGSEVHKIDATRTLVRSLSTKIKIAIHVVDKISMKINRLRDEELWPQLNEFIRGLTRMWKSMLECHNNQCRAIGEAKRLDTIAFQKDFTDAQFEATRQFQHDLINWTLWFSHWVGALKGYVRALNNWLMKCLLYIPEETPDGIVPFSPGRMGAPTVFVICNQWSQSMDSVSEKEVVDSMQEFASNVLQLWDRDKAEMRQKMLADKDERKLKSLEKEIQSLEKKMVLIPRGENDGLSSGNVVYQSETSKGGSLQASLKHVLEAMGKFTSNSLKIYEELLQRVEDDTIAREHEKVSQL